MNLNDDAKKAVQNLGDAINSAIGESRPIADAIEKLRALGYEPHLSVRLEIALENIGAGERGATEGQNFAESVELELTDEDLRTLQRMKIRF